MTMKRQATLLTLCFLFHLVIGHAAVFSQEASAEKAYTLEECIQIGLKNRPELEISKMDVLQAEYQIKEAQSYYYPRLNLTAGYTRFYGRERLKVDVDLKALKHLDPSLFALPDSFPTEFEVLNKTNWVAAAVDLTQPIYTFGQIEEGIKQAKIGRSIAVNQKEKKRTEVIFQVRQGYYQYLLAKEMLQILKEAETRANVVSKMVKIAYETAVPAKEEKGTTRIDYLKSRNFQTEVKAKLSEMNKNFKLAELALKMAMGLDLGAPLRVAEISMEGLPREAWSLEELRERTLTRNPDLKSVDLGVQFYDSRRKAATKEYFPKIGIQGQYIGPKDQFDNNNVWYAGVGFTVPLFNGFQTRAKIGQAEAQFEKTKGQKLVLEKALSVQIDHLNTSLMELKERIEIIRVAIKETQERVDLASDGYSAGITEYEELLLAQKAELEAKSNYLLGLFNYQMIKSEIEFISGIQ